MRETYKGYENEALEGAFGWVVMVLNFERKEDVFCTFGYQSEEMAMRDGRYAVDMDLEIRWREGLDEAS